MEKKGKILIATDFSKCADNALKVAWEWSKKLDLTLSVVNVADVSAGFSMSPFDHPSLTNYEGILREQFEGLLEDQIKKVCGDDIAKLEHQVLFGPAAETLLNKIETQNIELLVLGAKGHSTFEQLLIGSLTERMIQLSPVPVLAVKGDKIQLPKTISVALDLNHETIELFWAKKLAKAFNSKLNLIHAVSPEISNHELVQQEIERSHVQCVEDILNIGKKIAEEELDLASKELTEQGINCDYTLKTTDSMTPSKVLLEMLEENATNLLILGTHGRSGVSKWLLGSVAENLIRKATTSLLIMKNID